VSKIVHMKSKPVQKSVDCG